MIVGLPAQGWKGEVRFSPCQTYRYRLDRIWPDGSGTVLAIMLNPSTADEQKNDPTIRRVCGFARQWGAARLTIVNLFAYRATKPRDMIKAHRDGIDVIGPENDTTIADVSDSDELIKIVAAWGACSLAKERGRRVIDGPLAGLRIEALRLLADGTPEHPLYLPNLLAPVIYREGKAC